MTDICTPDKNHVKKTILPAPYYDANQKCVGTILVSDVVLAVISPHEKRKK